MEKYLAATRYIDHQEPAIVALAQQLAVDANGERAVVANCFEFVRDQIKHSGDFKLNPVTCKASDVLTVSYTHLTLPTILLV